MAWEALMFYVVTTTQILSPNIFNMSTQDRSKKTFKKS